MLIKSQKSLLRTKIKKIRDQLSENEVQTQSKKICDFILAKDWFKTAKKIAFYWPIKNEPNLLYLADLSLKLQKQIFFPRFQEATKNYLLAEVKNLKQDFQLGKYQIKEPKSNTPLLNSQEINSLDLWFVPGLAFDLKGQRLGFGQGYYDKLLKNFSKTKIGIAYGFQVIDSLPSETRDIKMDLLVTPTKIIKPNSG